MSPKIENYVDREQSWVKHWLLEKYLERLFLKVGSKWGRIVYIDGFAGPWESNTADLSDTSFAIAVRVMKRCSEALSVIGRRVQFEAHFLEKTPRAAARLIEYAERATSKEVVVTGHHLDFLNELDAISSWLTDKDFAFVLVDPLGYKTVAAPQTLAPLLRKRGVELVINLMFDHINRFLMADDQAANMREIFGDDYEEQLKRLDGPREHRIIKLYCQRIRSAASGNRIWSTAFPVEYPTRDRTYYYLVYATHDPTGLLTFGDTAEKASVEQHKAKSSLAWRKKEESERISDMFGAPTELTPVRYINNDLIRKRLLEKLSPVGKEHRVDNWFMADILEECVCFESDVQRNVLELVRDGI